MENIEIRALQEQFNQDALLETFDQLQPGESFILVKNQNPLSLYSRLEQDRKHRFYWKYLKRGPHYWKVEVQRIKNYADRKLGNLVAENYRYAPVFKEFELDYCQHGEQTLEQACKRKHINLEEVLYHLSQVEHMADRSKIKFNEWNVEQLIDYIVDHHHKYLREKLPDVLVQAQKVAKKHGRNYSETKAISYHFSLLHDEIMEHMKKEEKILFPYIKKLFDVQNGKAEFEKPVFQTVDNPIRKMVSEHDITGSEMKLLRKYSNDYTLPEDACETFRQLYENLKEIEEDLELHIHLENNILFPKAQVIEKEFVA